ncbi:MAG: hypothetical protein Q4G67_05575 [Actinomycetia bacterium]|nr:hypothetical protein [Actinomycetes bacterium]
MSWPVAMSVDDTIAILTPMDFARGSAIRSMEVQRLRAADGQWTTRVLYTTPDRLTHYAWPRGVDLAPAEVPLGAGIGLNEPAEFRSAVVELGVGGLHLDVDLTDAQGRRLECRARHPRPWQGFDLVAPPAAGIENPTSFFFPYLRHFGFATQPLDFEASFEGRPLELQRLPFPWRRRRASALKAARGSVIVELLKDGAAPLAVDDPHVEVDFDGNLAAVAIGTEVLDVRLVLDPALPPSGHLEGSVRSEWILTVGADPVAAGTVELAPRRSWVEVGWTITRGWGGAPRPASVWALTRLVRSLRRWPLAYSWTGRLEPGPPPRLVGGWRNARPRT